MHMAKRNAKSAPKSATKKAAAVNPDVLGAFNSWNATAAAKAVSNTEAGLGGGSDWYTPPEGEYYVRFSAENSRSVMSKPGDVCKVTGQQYPYFWHNCEIVGTPDEALQEEIGESFDIGSKFRLWHDDKSGKDKCIDAGRLKGVLVAMGVGNPPDDPAALVAKVCEVTDGTVWLVRVENVEGYDMLINVFYVEPAPEA
jgi:hypothetical protein